MAETIVELSRRYEVPGAEPFDSITLREPTYQDACIDGLGHPQEWQPNGGGGGMLVTYPLTVDRYAQRLIVKPGYEYIAQISALDATRLEKAICDFFTAPASTTSPTSSSSGSAGAQR